MINRNTKRNDLQDMSKANVIETDRDRDGEKRRQK